MTTAALVPVQPCFTDSERLALAGFLAGYRGLTREAYALDLRQFTAWCWARSLALFAVRRADIESFARELEARGRARATVTRRLCTIAGFYRYAVEEELLDHSPAAHVRRPRVDYESHAVALDRNELGALLVTAGLGPPLEHALISLLALNGLRVSETTGADIEHLGLERGHRTLTITRKGGKVVIIPLAPRTARAIDLAIGERTDGPVFLAADGRRLDRVEVFAVADCWRAGRGGARALRERICAGRRGHGQRRAHSALTGERGVVRPVRVCCADRRRRQVPPRKRLCPDPQTREWTRSAQLILLPTSDEEDRPASESASSRFARWLAWSASDAFAMRISCLIATLNPMTEITNPARLIQSPTLIFIGSSALIIEKGKATVTLFLGDTTLGAERDLRARAVPLSSAISQPPISQTDGAARCQAHRRSATTADSSVSGVVPQPYIRRQP